MEENFAAVQNSLLVLLFLADVLARVQVLRNTFDPTGGV